VGLNDLYEFDLVPLDDEVAISTNHWLTIQHHLLEMQPARTATLLGEPPRAIRVVGYGGTEVAPGLLAAVARLAGTSLRVVVPHDQ
jgi:hypothetical protein